ncbi:MAG: TAT-variant-translocated molybdopterin oxidoreductase [Holophagales bacterium]|nr:TAT-variant-translocated molybdopterin oxidoreductase [Holophagales bacterium]
MSLPTLRPEPAEGLPAGPAHFPLDLAEIRERLRTRQGPAFWRGIEELADDTRFREFLATEYPRHASDWDESLDRGFSRRRFLELGMASMALAGMTACTRQPVEKIVPYVKQPEEILPGVPLFFATAMTVGGFAQPLLAESHEGRPTKVEGNPEHPASLGGATAVAQASVLGLYDPDRLKVPTKLGILDTWPHLVTELQAAAKAQKQIEGAGLRILTETVTSPTLGAQMKALLAAFPKAKWHQWESAGRDAVRSGARIAFGQPAETRYDLGAADVVVALDSDFLASGPDSVRNAKAFSARRRLVGGSKEMSRFYAVEVSPTPTGTLADHRLPLRASALPAFAEALGAELGLAGFARPSGLDERALKFAGTAAKDLKAAAGRSVVVAGDFAPAEVHAAAHAMNEALGNVGKTVFQTDPVEAAPVDQLASLADLVADVKKGEVQVLLILGGNPVYDAPSDLAFGESLLKAGLRIHLTGYPDETSRYCQWAVPMAHFLEAWSDVRSLDGTAALVQPLVEPLYEGKSPHELLSVLLDETPRKGYDVVKEHWKAARSGEADFEAFWRKSLHDGVVPGTAFAAKVLPVRVAEVAGALAAAATAAAARPSDLEAVFRPDPSLLDGRFANNGWLQELPKPLSKLTWDNAAIVSPATAQKLGLQNEDVVKVTANGKSVELPVLIQPGQAAGVVTLHLGFGRAHAGRVGNGVGADVTPLRTTAAPWIAAVTLAKTGARSPLAHTQQHFRMEGREIVRVMSLPEYVKDPAKAKGHGLPPKDVSLFQPGWEYKENAWGLSVDLGSCFGCNACVVACQSENNIPIVGKEQVGRNREMQWIRVDQYYEGTDLENPEVHHQPLMCQHCEMAPCEVVCPVAATVHGAEGLNEMAYNRCVGTRYCSNNCPYHVRRFNFLEYNGEREKEPVLKMLANPDVTVRSRGVMEKCTFCIQRINRARIVAEREGRAIRDGEIRTACQQTCPADAIVFGNINDPAAKVTKLREEPRTYWLLEELNTRPRTTYMAKVTNPNPDAEAG